MGRYSEQLAVRFADFAGVRSPATALDVGCGPGALTAVLVERLGDSAVAAVEPSAPFVAAAQERVPTLDVRQASAEELPFDGGGVDLLLAPLLVPFLAGPGRGPGGRFDLVLAQLVVHFMADAVRGLGEMVRVARPGGTIAACVWDYAGRRSPLDPFWAAAHDVTPTVRDETMLAGARRGDLAELFS